MNAVLLLVCQKLFPCQQLHYRIRISFRGNGSPITLVSQVNYRQPYGQHSGVIVACHHWQSDFCRGHLIIWENALKGQGCFLSWQACHIRCQRKQRRRIVAEGIVNLACGESLRASLLKRIICQLQSDSLL